MKITKRILSVVLSAAMTFSVIAVQPKPTVMAQKNEWITTSFNYELPVAVKGIYFGTRTEKFDILPMQITGDNISVDYSQVKASYEFIGKDITPIIRLKCNGEILNPMVDYTVEYKNNFYPGKAGIIIKGIDNYSGEIVKEFEIVKKEIKNVTIRTEFNSNKELVITVNNGSWDMTKGVDYDYTVTTDDRGNITITFTGLGKNYTGTTVKVIPADENPNTPTIVAATESMRIGKTIIKIAKNLKGKKVKLSWKKTGWKHLIIGNTRFQSYRPLVGFALLFFPIVFLFPTVNQPLSSINSPCLL